MNVNFNCKTGDIIEFDSQNKRVKRYVIDTSPNFVTVSIDGERSLSNFSFNYEELISRNAVIVA